MSDFSNLKNALKDIAIDVERKLDELLFLPQTPDARLTEAMRYSTLGAGKRLRPFIVMQSCSLFDIPSHHAIRVAAALECVHCYSLIHDDLPAMDDDIERRGKPTCHIQFDEATAILAGDALLTKAFEILADPLTHPDSSVRSNLILSLSQSIGHQGMCAGQMIDIMEEKTPTATEEILTRLQYLKTGKMFEFASLSGAIMANVAEKERKALEAYAHDFGLAFQLTDDLLDHDGFAAIMGEEKTQEHAKLLVDQAIEHLLPFGEKAILLQDLARFILNRKN